MEKSRLFNLILSQCSPNPEADVSVDRIAAVALNYIGDVYSGKIPSPEGESAAELEKVKSVIDEYNVDYISAAQNIMAHLAANADDDFVGHLQYRNIVVSLSDEETVTLDKFMSRVINCPTDAISKYIIGNRTEEGKADTERPEKSQKEQSDDKPANPYTEDEDDEPLPHSDSNVAERRRRLLERLSVTFDEGLEEDKEAVEKQQKQITVADIALKAKKLSDFLFATVYGQDAAVNTFVSGYFQAELSALTDKKRTRPRATFLFAGPPGVGKTFLSEQVASALGLPFMRFDMSEYADKEANLEFCGSDKVYKNSKEGNVTSFVAKHPNAILLFDEVEKAHLNVIHLFLQLLDAGRLRDNHTDEEVSFKDTIIIFTTNAGKALYEDECVNLTTVSRKSIIKALGEDINPVTQAPLFPAAICSRFAYGNVIMFNRLDANYLLKISVNELKKQAEGIESGTGLRVSFDRLLPYAILYSEGGLTDARTVKGKSASFIYNELYELFRLMQSEKNNYDIGKVKEIEIKLDLPADPKILSLFKNNAKPNVLIFGGKNAKKCAKLIKCANVFVAESIAAAEEIKEKHDITVVVCEVGYGAKKSARKVLNIDDVISDGRDFLYYFAEHSSIDMYVLEEKNGDISDEEFASLAASRAKGIISLIGGKSPSEAVEDACTLAYQQNNLRELARANKVLSHKTLQSVCDDGSRVEIALFDFKLTTALDAGDNGSVLDGVSRPNVKFTDVIGAVDAKDELKYFIDYLKNPAKFVRRGVRAPKGILLYGPPGTGKTLLAKAMAGESDVTFVRAEGNQFLKKYIGEGAESVHKLFNTARKYAPAILFIDEIDAIAKERGEDHSRSDDVLTSFLTEMDGFNTDKDRPVFVLAATNYDVEQGSSRSLDAALLRRFDRKIYVDLPNREERLQFINQKLKRAEGNEVSGGQVENLAMRSTGMSLADLDSVFELALRNVIKDENLTLSDGILEEAFETFNSGSAKKWNDGELMRTARHEAGHALMCYLGGETPSYLTIVARGSHGGYMQHADSEGKGTYTKSELLARVRTALGGRAAEIVYYGDEDGVSTGASGDLHTATNIIQNMICSYGMDDSVGLGSVELRNLSSTPHYSQVVARVNELLAKEFNSVKDLIASNRAAIDALVDVLIEKNSLKSDEIEEILKGKVKKL